MRQKLRLLLIAACAIISFTSSAYDFTDKNFTYTIIFNSMEARVISYEGSSTKLVIPSTIIFNSKLYTVTSIGKSAFKDNTNLKSVTIPNSITTIYDSAFEGCNGLTSIKFSNSLTTIGSYTFANCTGLTSVKIPETVTSIGSFAFSGCTGLTSVSIPESVTTIDNYTFYGCNSLTSVEIPNSVTSIGNSAFEGCRNLTFLEIPEFVTSLGLKTFYNCDGLTEVFYNASEPATVNRDCFYGCYHATLFVPEEAIDKYREISPWKNFNKIGRYHPALVGMPGKFTYEYNGQTLTYIVDKVDRTVSVTENKVSGDIIIPSIVKNKDLEFPVTSIDSSAFSGCTELTSIEIPNSVTSIGSNAFQYCRGLTSVKISTSVTSIGSYAFASCGGLTSVEIPSSVTLIGNNAFQYTGLTSVDISNSVTSIGKEVFRECTGLTSVEIPNSVTSIGNFAFYGCSGLTSLDIPNSVTSIGDYAFASCGGLTSLDIPNSVISIGNDAFSGCANLTSVKIPNSVTSIGARAFLYCSNLEKVEFASIESLCNIPFKYLSDNPLSYAGHLYINGQEVTHVEIPGSVKSIGNFTFYGFTGLTSLDIPNSVTTIGDYAFENCTGLTSVEIPNSVTKIGSFAFSNCQSLKQITLPPSIADDGFLLSVFSDCNLDSLIIGCRLNRKVGYPTAPVPYVYTTTVDLSDAPSSWVESTFFVLPKYYDSYKSVFPNVECLVEPTELTVTSDLQNHGAVNKGDKIQLTATIYPENTTLKQVYWESTRPDIAIVDNHGLVTIVGDPGDMSDNPCEIRAITIYPDGPVASVSITTDGIGIMPTVIRLDSDNIHMNIGDETTIAATVLPENATERTVTWSSSDENVATVDSNGTVHAVAPGEAVITASCGDISASCQVYVESGIESVLVESLTLPYDCLWVKIGESRQLSVTVFPENATNKTLVYKSDNENVATVDENGFVTAHSVASCYITVSTVDGSGLEVKCLISGYIPIEELNLSHESLQLKVGEDATVTATVLPEDTTYNTVTWSSSDDGVATVDSDGTVHAVAPGEAVITASCGDISASCQVYVESGIESVLVESLTLPYDCLWVKIGESRQLSVTVFPENATNKTLVYKSDNENVATVDENGFVTAHSVASCYITVSTVDGSGLEVKCLISGYIPIEELNLSHESLQLKVGDETTVTATVLPEATAYNTVTWSSSDDGVATVDSDGTVHAVAPGVVEITASCDGLTATCRVTVEPVLAESVVLSHEIWSGKTGESFQLSVTVLPENTTNKTIVYGTDNEGVAIVDDNGVVTVRGDGSCNISASTIDGSELVAKCVITGMSGIESIFSDSDVLLDVYNQQGMLIRRECKRDDLKQLQPGLYIIHYGNVVRKIILTDK